MSQTKSYDNERAAALLGLYNDLPKDEALYTIHARRGQRPPCITGREGLEISVAGAESSYFVVCAPRHRELGVRGLNLDVAATPEAPEKIHLRYKSFLSRLENARERVRKAEGEREAKKVAESLARRKVNDEFQAALRAELDLKHIRPNYQLDMSVGGIRLTALVIPTLSPQVAAKAIAAIERVIGDLVEETKEQTHS